MLQKRTRQNVEYCRRACPDRRKNKPPYCSLNTLYHHTTCTRYCFNCVLNHSCDNSLFAARCTGQFVASTPGRPFAILRLLLLLLLDIPLPSRRTGIMMDIWMLDEHLGGFGMMELESGFRNPYLDGGTGIWVVGWFLSGCVVELDTVYLDRGCSRGSDHGSRRWRRWHSRTHKRGEGGVGTASKAHRNHVNAAAAASIVRGSEQF